MIWILAVVGLWLGLRHGLDRWQQARIVGELQRSVPEVLAGTSRSIRAGISAPFAFAQELSALTQPLAKSCAASAIAALHRGDGVGSAVTLWRRDTALHVRTTLFDELHAAVQLSESFGGLRASTLEVLADTQRERAALRQEIKAQSAQAKASALVMTMAPLLFCFQLVARDERASHLLLHTSIGWMLLFVGGSLDALAWLWIWRLTSERHTRRVRNHRVTRWRPLLRRFVVGSPAPSKRSQPQTSFLTRFGQRCDRVLQRCLADRREVLDALLGSPSIDRARRVGLTFGIVPLLLVLRPLFGSVSLVVLLGGPHLHRRTEKVRLQKLREQEMPEVVEQLRVALECGASVPNAFLSVATKVGPGLLAATESAADGLRNGQRFDDVMKTLAIQAPELRAMTQLLCDGATLGIGLAELLRALGDQARASRRRVAEAKARRLPVVLLFPVVCLTLPAFVLLTVAPLLLSGLGSLHF